MTTSQQRLNVVITGRQSGFSRNEAEGIIRKHGGSVRQLVTAGTDFFFDFAENGKGQKCESWMQAGMGRPRKLGADAFDLLANNPDEFFARYGGQPPSATAGMAATGDVEPTIDPAAMIPKRKSMFAMNI
jgi:hypothetical protein